MLLRVGELYQEVMELMLHSFFFLFSFLPFLRLLVDTKCNKSYIQMQERVVFLLVFLFLFF